MSILKRLSVAAIAALCFCVAGCAGTRAAYESAETLDAKAYVVSEHYAAILREANELADRGAPRELVERMQAADRVAAPAVLQLRQASATYTAAKTAQNAAALQAALDSAAVQVAAFLRLVRSR
jgi:leucyl aminopeptidase (aminopeptidase T)